MESKIILYHSNEKEKCKEFVNKENTLIISKNLRDDIWLGKGMYFWDNIGNAKWWHRKQSNRYPEKKYCITIANATLNKLLDLTNYEIYMSLDKLWENICKLCNYNSNVPLGKKLNFLFDSFGFEEKYDLIKVYGKYNGTPNNGFFQFDYNTMKTEPTIAVKCIYNVKNVSCIIEKDLVKEEKE